MDKTDLFCLQGTSQFTKERADLKSIYTTYIRPVLEQSSVVWHSSISRENCLSLERVQRSAVRLIIGGKNFDYQASLKKLQLSSLEERRTKLCLNFAKRATLNSRTNQMFPIRKEIRTNRRKFQKNTLE